MEDTEKTALTQVVVVDCSGLSDTEIVTKVEEINMEQELSEDEGILHLLLTFRAEASLTNTDEGGQHLLVEVWEVDDEEFDQFMEYMTYLREQFDGLDVEIKRHKLVAADDQQEETGE